MIEPMVSLCVSCRRLRCNFLAHIPGCTRLESRLRECNLVPNKSAALMATLALDVKTIAHRSHAYLFVWQIQFAGPKIAQFNVSFPCVHTYKACL